MTQTDLRSTASAPQRAIFLDIAKGLSIWCIVLLHYEQGLFSPEVNFGIGSFMIALFYVSSGWLSEASSTHYPLRAFVAKRWQQLGVPYVWWTAIILGFDLVLLAFGYYDLRYIGQEVYKSVTLRGIGTLWFLPALFIGEVFWRYVWCKRHWAVQLLIAGLLVSYNALYYDISSQHTDSIARLIDAPFRTLSNAAVAALNIATGALFYRYAWPKLRQQSAAIIGLWGIGLYVLFYLVTTQVATSIVPLNIALHAGATLLAPLGVLLMVYGVQACLWLHPLAYWGRHSLNLMVTHYSIVCVLFVITITKGLGQPFEQWWALGSFVLSIPLQYALVPIIDRYLPQSLGKEARS